ncbi:MAG TPA: hypothetical protein VKA94_17285 [Hyphomicrobiales bacterium]|nr:hypothetical protein [Hyphomicrobiales bacterium]
MKSLTSTSFAAIAAGFLAFSAPANATDLLDGLNDPAPQGTAVNWSGVVFGGNIGYTTFNHELDGDFDVDLGKASYLGFINFDGISSDGINGCGIIALQKQAYQLVYGIEGHGCYGNVSTDLEIVVGDLVDEKESLELDYSYAVYGKIGIARGPWLASLLGGYKWQHYELGESDDTVGGLSGGGVLEVKLDDAGNVGLGLEGIYTDYDTQGDEDLKIKSSSFDAKLRLTYTLN